MICGHELNDDGDVCMQAHGHDTETIPHMSYEQSKFFWKGYECGIANSPGIAELKRQCDNLLLMIDNIGQSCAEALGGINMNELRQEYILEAKKRD